VEDESLKTLSSFQASPPPTHLPSQLQTQASLEAEASEESQTLELGGRFARTVINN
jgi:hypothetical protein